jgi:5-methylcytosine-specific restriction protein A
MPRRAWQGSTRRSRLPADWATRIQPAVLRRDRYACQLKYDCCIGKATQGDHIKAGDDHSMSNLQAACAPCHARKSSHEGASAAAAKRADLKRPAEPHPGIR